MMTDTKPYSLTPLFDTLEYLKKTLAGSITGLNNIQRKELELAGDFLYSYRGSEATFNAYRREVERLLQWCWWQAKKNLNELRRPDIEEFIEFCQKPPLAWIGTKNASRFIESGGKRVPNPEWRPYTVAVDKVARQHGEEPNPKKYQLSQKAVQAIFAILGSFFNYLIQEEYVDYNPIAQIRQKSKYIRKQQEQPVIRRLSELQWSYVIETAEMLAEANPALHERTLFIMQALYGMYLRISELAASIRWQPQMGHFFKDRESCWWFKTVGKGNKERIIAVSDAMLSAFKRYRISLGLTALPYPAEATPLLSKALGAGPIKSVRRIRVIVQDCFDAAVSRLNQDGFTDEAEELRAATVHWLRHTGISDDVKTRPREHVRDDAGHGSSAITDKYIDVRLRARHQSARKKMIKPD